MQLLRIVKSPKPDKKWEAQFSTDTEKVKKVNFGAAGMMDFTLGATPEQARLFRARHAKDLKTMDPTRPGYLSYYILWSSPDMARNIRNYKKMFNL